MRVHEHLLQRGDLPKPDHDRAQHALALDYIKAGLLDRAETALQKHEGTTFEDEARLALLSIYERSRDWAHASDIASKLNSVGHGSFSGRLAHYLCEQAHSLVAAGDLDKAAQLLEQAINVDKDIDANHPPSTARPLIDLAKLNLQRGKPEKALASLQLLEKSVPQAFPLAAGLLVNIAQTETLLPAVLGLLKAHYQHTPSVDVMDAIAKLNMDPAGRRQNYMDHLETEASLVAATRWVAGEQLGTQRNHELVQRALDQAIQPLMRYRCAACGFEATQHFWHCPGCQAWDSYPSRRVEEL